MGKPLQQVLMQEGLVLSFQNINWNVFYMLTYCCQSQAGFLEICMHTWELFPLCATVRRMLISSGKRPVLIPKDTYDQYQLQHGNDMHDSQSWLVWHGPKVLPEVLQYCCAMGNSRGIKMGNYLPQITPTYRLQGRTRSKPLECTMHCRKSWLFKPGMAWSLGLPCDVQKSIAEMLGWVLTKFSLDWKIVHPIDTSFIVLGPCCNNSTALCQAEVPHQLEITWGGPKWPCRG